MTTLSEIVRAKFREHPDKESCIAAVRKAMPLPLTEAIINEAIRAAVLDFYGDVAKDSRAAIRAAVIDGAERGRIRNQVAGDVGEDTARRSLLRTYILAGRPIGQWTGTELAAHCEQQRHAMRRHHRNLVWYEAMAAKAGKRRLEKVITDAEAEEMLLEADAAAK